MKLKLLLMSCFITLSAFSKISIDSGKNDAPRVSIITSVFKGDEFIEGFMEDIVNVKNFENYELILINANSPHNEEIVINEYCKKYPNIVYKKLEKDPGVYGVWNLGIQLARAPYVTNSNLDDRRNPDMLEEHLNFLDAHPDIDLVYSGYFLTHAPNETFETNTYRYVVEPQEFAKNRLFMCMPGPQPTWRTSMHTKYGWFREDMPSSADLELWNRVAQKGAQFAALPGYSTLYYFNPEGVSTAASSKKSFDDTFVRGAYGTMWNDVPENGPKLLIKIPTRSRPQQFFEQLDRYYRQLSGAVNYHFLITCDRDDVTMNNKDVIKRLSWYPNLTYSFGDSTTKVEAYNRDLTIFTDYDIIVVVGDDMEPVTLGYDKVIVDTMLAQFPDYDGVLNFHDGFVGSETITYPIIGKKYLDRFGYIFHPLYRSLFANEELTLVARALGKEYISMQTLIKHNHPIFGLGQWDDLYSRNENFKDYDKNVFTARKNKNFGIESKAQFQKEWSILICTLEERKESFDALYSTLQQQIIDAGLEEKIEILSFCDNRENSIGFKRNALVRQSKGKYFSFIDDDDVVHANYIPMIYEKLQKNPDNVSLIGIMTTRGLHPIKFIHSIDYKEKYQDHEGTFRSPPNHLNPLKRVIGAQFLFPEKNFGEDYDWATRIASSQLLKKEEKIDVPYYFYRYDGKYHVVIDSTKVEEPVKIAPTYYSQIGQDKYLNENIFKNKRNGVFVEVGAYDGVKSSNSYFFEKELGWKGLCIEPAPAAFKKLAQNRNCITLNCGAGLNEGFVDFVAIDTDGTVDMLSGIRESYPEEHWQRLQREVQETGSSYEVIKVPIYRLDNVFSQHDITAIDYLSVDTEGSELEVLKSIDFNKVHISYITVENNFNDTSVRTFLEEQGFELYRKIEWDDLYRNKKNCPSSEPINSLQKLGNREITAEEALNLILLAQGAH